MSRAKVSFIKCTLTKRPDGSAFASIEMRSGIGGQIISFTLTCPFRWVPSRMPTSVDRARVAVDSSSCFVSALRGYF